MTCIFLYFVHEDTDARQSRRIWMRRKLLAESRCAFRLVNPERFRGQQIFQDLEFHLDRALV
jgi:hypothetical protein